MLPCTDGAAICMVWFASADRLGMLPNFPEHKEEEIVVVQGPRPTFCKKWTALSIPCVPRALDSKRPT
eukprot:3878538-Amphidinium_carterae.1